MKKNNEIKDLILKTSYDLDLLLSRKLKSYNLALTEFNTLKVLNDNGDCTVQNMAKQVLLTSGSMTYIVDKLVAKSCIEKVKQVEDNRVFMLSLTKKGKTLYIFFQGSNSIWDWVRNLSIFKAPYKDMKVKYKVHSGFLSA